MDYRVKCVTCGKVLESEDIMYSIRLYDIDLSEYLYCPACSTQCAEKAVAKQLEKIHAINENLINQEYQKISVINFLTIF